MGGLALFFASQLKWYCCLCIAVVISVWLSYVAMYLAGPIARLVLRQVAVCCISAQLGSSRLSYQSLRQVGEGIVASATADMTSA